MVSEFLQRLLAVVIFTRCVRGLGPVEGLDSMIEHSATMREKGAPPSHPTPRRPSRSFGPLALNDCGVTVWAGVQPGIPWGPQDHKAYDQDRELHAQSGGRCIFGVFDGHGAQGGYLSTAARDEVKRQFDANKMTDAASVAASLQGVAAYINKHPEASGSGTTVAGFIVSKTGDFLVFHAGDTRVVWGEENGKFIGETKDHDCYNPKEFAKLKKKCAEGRMFCDGNWMSMVLRSFGDRDCHGGRTDQLYSKADVERVPRGAARWLVIGSDGVLGPLMENFGQLGFSSQQALTYLTNRTHDAAVRKALTDIIEIGDHPLKNGGRQDVLVGGKHVQYLAPNDDRTLLLVRIGPRTPVVGVESVPLPGTMPAVAQPRSTIVKIVVAICWLVLIWLFIALAFFGLRYLGVLAVERKKGSASHDLHQS